MKRTKWMPADSPHPQRMRLQHIIGAAYRIVILQHNPFFWSSALLHTLTHLRACGYPSAAIVPAILSAMRKAQIRHGTPHTPHPEPTNPSQAALSLRGNSLICGLTRAVSLPTPFTCSFRMSKGLLFEWYWLMARMLAHSTIRPLSIKHHRAIH